MLLRPETLPRDPDILIPMMVELDAENEHLRQLVKTYQGMVFGSRSERSSVILDGQDSLDLGDLATDITPVAANDDAPAGEARPARKPRRNVGALPKHLPRIEHVIEPESADCPCCAGQLHPQ